MSPARLASLSDEELLERVQRQTFRFFWEAGHPVSGLVPDRRPAGKGQSTDLAATGGSGFAVMALVVAVERGWITREHALERLGAMLDVLVRATCYHGALPHFLDGRTGATLPFSRKDDG
ncbi:MAG: glucoamylase family protein, partial [Steroidobacteraceae bacterium]